MYGKHNSVLKISCSLYVLHGFLKTNWSIQFHSVNVCTEYRAILQGKDWFLLVTSVPNFLIKNHNNILSLRIVFDFFLILAWHNWYPFPDSLCLGKVINLSGIKKIIQIPLQIFHILRNKYPSKNFYSWLWTRCCVSFLNLELIQINL